MSDLFQVVGSPDEAIRDIRDGATLCVGPRVAPSAHFSTGFSTQTPASLSPFIRKYEITIQTSVTRSDYLPTAPA